MLIGAVPPIMVKTPANPGGLPIEVFDGFRKQLAANRAQFYLDFASGPFYGYNRPGAKVSQGVIDNWWRQAMMGSAKAQYDGIKAFSETDFTEDLKIIDVPTLVMHGDDDQIVPIADSAPLSAKLLKKGTLKVYREVPARHVHDARRRDQRRPARLHQGLNWRAAFRVVAELGSGGRFGGLGSEKGAVQRLALRRWLNAKRDRERLAHMTIHGQRLGAPAHAPDMQKGRSDRTFYR